MRKYNLPGPPISLKNSKRLVRRGNRTIPIKSQKAMDAEKAAMYILGAQRKGFTWECPISIKLTFYGAWKRGGGNVPDLSNLYQGPEDFLEKAGIIANDRLIESHDGSRRVCMCDICPKRTAFERGPKKGQLKPDCGRVKQCTFERVEIEISEY